MPRVSWIMDLNGGSKYRGIVVAWIVSPHDDEVYAVVSTDKGFTTVSIHDLKLEGWTE